MNKLFIFLPLHLIVGFFFSSSAQLTPGHDFSPYSSVVLSNDGYINKLTGQPVYSVPLRSISSNSGLSVNLSLQYGAGINLQANGLSQIGWLGLGWHLDFGAIYVDEKKTVNRRDDRYYFVSPGGSVSEIVKSSTENRWMVKDNPYLRLFENLTTINSKTVIKYWLVKDLNGTTYIYGDSGSVQNASRTKGVDSLNNFPYYWALQQVTDNNGGSTRYSYHTYEDHYKGYDGDYFTNEFFIDKIYIADNGFHDNGDTIKFTLSKKDTTEYFVSDLQNRRFLRNISYIDRYGNEKERYDLIYSGDPGQIPHLDSTASGVTQRLLYGIQASHMKLNLNFDYGRLFSYRGMLNRIDAPLTGKSVRFNYSIVSLPTTAEYGNYLNERYPLVTKVETYDGINGTPALETNYSYSYLDPAKRMYVKNTWLWFWKEDTSSDMTGKVVTEYDINPANNKLGKVTHTYTYSKSNKLVSENIPQITLRTFNGFYPDSTDTVWYDQMNTQNQTRRDRVLSTTRSPMGCYNTTNGLPSLSFTVKNAGEAIAKKTSYAFEPQNYPDMGPTPGTNQLVQVASQITYKINPASDTTGSLTPNVVSASYTTWQPFGSFSRPYQTYVWSSRLGPGDLPGTSFVAFSKDNPTANNWKLTSTNERYSRFGTVLETSSPDAGHKSVINRNDYNFPIASVSNARYDECAVFTGDYDINESGHTDYFDYMNGWKKGGSALSAARTHFGEKSVLVNGTGIEGPNRIVKLYNGQDYIFTAWVFVESGSLQIGGEYRVLSADTIPYPTTGETKSFGIGPVTKTASSDWQFVTMKIPASRDLSSSDWTGKQWGAYIHLGSSASVTAYVDDIRFYPSQALLATSYYDMQWRTVRMSVDMNANPGVLTRFDGFGRDTLVSKVNKLRSAQDAGYSNKLQKKEYHLMGESLRLVQPNGGEVWNNYDQNYIRWTSVNGISGIDIDYRNGAGSWQSIVRDVPGNTCQWGTSVTDTSGNYRIRVKDHANPVVYDESDGKFTIRNNNFPVQPRTKSICYHDHSTTALNFNVTIDPAFMGDIDGDRVMYRMLVVFMNNHKVESCSRQLYNSTAEQDLKGIPFSDDSIYSCQIIAEDERGRTSVENPNVVFKVLLPAGILHPYPTGPDSLCVSK